MAWTDGIPAPSNFRLWSGIGAIAGAMERKYWSMLARGAIYPNMFIVLTAKPGIGKTEAIKPVEDLWYATGKVWVSPDSMTSASLLDQLMESDRKVFIDGQLRYEYHAMATAADEFSVLINAFDNEFLGRLCRIWDCRRALRVRRKYIKEEISIINPIMTILAGVQPGFLNSVMPEEAWRMGFPARLCMVFADSGPTVELWQANPQSLELRKKLVLGLNAIIGTKEIVRHGQFQWHPHAQIAMSAWHRAGFPPQPDHSRLEGYNAKRIQTIIKLCMIASASRDLCESMTVTLEDYERARGWMLDMEASMGEVFRDMISQSDQQIINELYHYVWREFVKTKRPMSLDRVWRFLSERIKAVEKIPKIIDAMVNSDLLIQDVVDKSFVPRPKDEKMAELMAKVTKA